MAVITFKTLNSNLQDSLHYMAFVGIIRIQFNGAVKEGYPELYKKCKV